MRRGLQSSVCIVRKSLQKLKLALTWNDHLLNIVEVSLFEFCHRNGCFNPAGHAPAIILGGKEQPWCKPITYLLVGRRATIFCYFARWIRRVAMFQLYVRHLSDQPYSCRLPADGSEQPPLAILSFSWVHIILGYIEFYRRVLKLIGLCHTKNMEENTIGCKINNL